MRYGVCCIVLALKEKKLSFQKMTYSSFSRMEREKALEILGSRILNNMKVTLESIKFCSDRGWCYRLSSDLFPLVTYDKAEVSLEDLPQKSLIYRSIDEIRSYISDNDVRISCHPDQFNVLASENSDALARTFKELNFQSWFMDMIGCAADYSAPINIHINNNSGSRKEIAERFMSNFENLDENCKKRLVIENDDKASCWSVRTLFEHFRMPLTFDYLHHKCHPGEIPESEAIEMCYSTWGSFKPLFHFSEGRDSESCRAHADYPSRQIETHGLDFDLDFEFKMKDLAIERYMELCLAN